MNALVFTVQNNMVVFCHQARFQQRQKNNAGGQRRRDEMTSKLIKALILTTVLCYGQKNWLENPSLKAQPDGSIPGWTAYRGTSGAPMHVDYENKISGKNSVWGEYYKGKVPEGREAGLKTPAQFDVLTENYFPFGIMQDVTFEKPTMEAVTFGGWSKAENVKSIRQYCIYLDVEYDDGTFDWGRQANWAAGTHEWQHALGLFWPKKPVKKISFFAFIRHDAEGKAWFDDMELFREPPDVHVTGFSTNTLAPLHMDGMQLQWGFFKNGISCTAKLLDEKQNIIAEESWNSRTIKWNVPNAKGAKICSITASDGKVERTFQHEISFRFDPPVNPVKSGYRIWIEDSMVNVSPLTYPTQDAKSTIDVELARGERESAQLLVTASNQAALERVNVTISPLRHASDKELSGLAKWERVAYLTRVEPYARHPDGIQEGQIWLPDPLLPPREFTVPKNATQGVWLTFFADRNATLGDYTGEVVVTIDGKTQSVPIKLTVFDFALPETFSYPTAFSIMDGWLFNAYPDGDKNARRRQAWDVMLDHRLNPDDISRTEPPRIEDLLHAQKRGMNRFNVLNMVPKPKGNPLWVCWSPVKDYTPELFQEFKTRLDPYVQQLRKHNLTQYAYVYGFDERSDEFYPTIAKVHQFIKENYPDIAFFTTSKMYGSLKKDPTRTDCYANDWYCPLTTNYNDELSETLRKKGHQVWWYTCGAPWYPDINFASVEYPFIEARLIAWLGYQHKVDGFLFWHVNLWKGPYRFDETTCYQPDFQWSNITGTIGDGQFLYPGIDGVLPSIRLANLRDGSEDYDYLTLLGESARSLCDQLAQPGSVRNFTRDHRKLRQLRRDMAQKLTQK
jgi:hypothetical protein